MLLKKGIRHCWMAGAMPFGFVRQARGWAGLHVALRAGARGSGDAGKLVEADLDPRRDRGHAGNCVVVADAMGVTGAGIFGDILCMRMVKRGVAALITDGVMRDKHGVLATGLPVWCAGVAAPASVNQLTFVGWNEPIGCGGCAIFPDDIIVADDDGAVVIPQALVDFVAAKAPSTSCWKAGWCRKSRRAPNCPASIRPTKRTRSVTRLEEKIVERLVEIINCCPSRSLSVKECERTVTAVRLSTVIRIEIFGAKGWLDDEQTSGYDSGIISADRPAQHSRAGAGSRCSTCGKTQHARGHCPGGAGGRADRRADGDDLIRADGGSCENASRDFDLNCRRHITTAVVEIANGNARARATVLERAAALCHH